MLHKEDSDKKIKISPMHEKEVNEIQSLMQEAYIPGMSIASISNGEVQTAALGLRDAQSTEEVTTDTQFWACSLSKSVFAYLVLKLIKDEVLHADFLNEKFTEEKLLAENIIEPNSLEEKTPFNGKVLTPRMMLSHQTGLPNEGPPDQIFLNSEPQSVFRYSGEGYVLLQKIIEKRTGKKLHELAKEKSFDELGMSRSTFLFPEEEINLTQTHNNVMLANQMCKRNDNNNNAAGSLHTTASDYARFLIAFMNDPDILKMISPEVIDMQKDIDSISMQKKTQQPKVSNQTLSFIDWGLGFGLQKNEKNEIVSAFHWGHGPGARTFFLINLAQDPKSAIVYLTNSENGLAIAKDLASPIVGDITPTMNFLSEKYDYENIHQPNWKQYHEDLIKDYEYLIEGKKEEKKENFDKAIELYKKGAELKPNDLSFQNKFQYHIFQAEIKNIEKTKQEVVNFQMLKKLIGNYGPLKILVDENSQTIQIQEPGGNPPRNLKIINANTLLDGQVILKFERDELQNPISLNCYFSDFAPCTFPSSNNMQKKLSTTAATSKILNTSSAKGGKEKKTVDDFELPSQQVEKRKKTFAQPKPTKKESADDSNITYQRRSGK